jgi:hypothetical protein
MLLIGDMDFKSHFAASFSRGYVTLSKQYAAGLGSHDEHDTLFGLTVQFLNRPPIVHSLCNTPSVLGSTGPGCSLLLTVLRCLLNVFKSAAPLPAGWDSWSGRRTIGNGAGGAGGADGIGGSTRGVSVGTLTAGGSSDENDDAGFDTAEEDRDENNEDDDDDDDDDEDDDDDDDDDEEEIWRRTGLHDALEPGSDGKKYRAWNDASGNGDGAEGGEGSANGNYRQVYHMSLPPPDASHIIVQHKRYMPLLFDLRYILAIPGMPYRMLNGDGDENSDDDNGGSSGSGIAHTLRAWVELLRCLQWVHPQQRKRGEHVQREDSQWVAAFNLLIIVVGNTFPPIMKFHLAGHEPPSYPVEGSVGAASTAVAAVAEVVTSATATDMDVTTKAQHGKKRLRILKNTLRVCFDELYDWQRAQRQPQEAATTDGGAGAAGSAHRTSRRRTEKGPSDQGHQFPEMQMQKAMSPLPPSFACITSRHSGPAASTAGEAVDGVHADGMSFHLPLHRFVAMLLVRCSNLISETAGEVGGSAQDKEAEPMLPRHWADWLPLRRDDQGGSGGSGGGGGGGGGTPAGGGRGHGDDLTAETLSLAGCVRGELDLDCARLLGGLDHVAVAHRMITNKFAEASDLRGRKVCKS